ncbi:hypothetical protein B0H14DRAFT_3124145 [Mycena olivaceomarginata]|nr:hypothetical protein B0H14DRAFT_3124145 [Mycena olivaceomarginata]
MDILFDAHFLQVSTKESASHICKRCLYSIGKGNIVLVQQAGKSLSHWKCVDPDGKQRVLSHLVKSLSDTIFMRQLESSHSRGVLAELILGGLDHPNVTATTEYTSVTSAGLDSSPDSEDLNDELVNLNADHRKLRLAHTGCIDALNRVEQSLSDSNAERELQAIEIKRLTSGNVTLRKTISNMGHFTDAITQQFLDKEQKQKERIDNLISERYALDEAVSEAKQLLEENNAALETQANELERLRTENSASRNQISNIERNPLRPHQTARADMRTRPTTWEIRPRLRPPELQSDSKPLRNLKLAYVHICRVQNNQVLANSLSSVSNEHFQVYRLWRDRQFGVIVVRRGKNNPEELKWRRNIVGFNWRWRRSWFLEGKLVT